MDEFEMIAKSFRGNKVARDDIEAATIVYGCWLVDEVERLRIENARMRKIEDAARVPLFVLDDDEAMKRSQITWMGNLASVLMANPRPEEPR